MKSTTEQISQSVTPWREKKRKRVKVTEKSDRWNEEESSGVQLLNHCYVMKMNIIACYRFVEVHDFLTLN